MGFIADRGDGAQAYLIRPEGGEAEQLTSHDGGISAFRFSSDGSRVAFTATDPAPDAFEEREERYGDYAVEDADFRMTHLWVMEARAGAEPRRLTEGRGYTVGGGFGGGSFDWSPDGREIAFGHTPTPQVNSFPHADISVVDVDAGTVRPLATDPGPESGPMWSPDGAHILYSTIAGANPFYGNTELAVIPSGGGEPRIVTADFDENPSPVAWTDEGILFVASQRTARHLFLLDPESGQVTLQADTPEMIMTADLSDDGTAMAIQGENRTTMGEIFRLSRSPGTARSPRRVTDMTAQVAEWGDLGSREVIQWESEDGGGDRGSAHEASGIRPRPPLSADGGDPRWPDRDIPTPVDRRVRIPGHRMAQEGRRGDDAQLPWLGRIRCRLPRPQRAQTWVSATRGTCSPASRRSSTAASPTPTASPAMGWSQGGYISAFLTTSSDRFRAISVGAGISNWMTYYVNTDIHSFTREYLEATPWDDPEIYAKTSPMTYIRQASTPTLIQHGEFDARVPTPNAYELYQGLQDVGVDTRLIIYKGFGHGITKPRERLAAMWHNWEWFARHIWGESVEMPITEGGGGR